MTPLIVLVNLLVLILGVTGVGFLHFARMIARGRGTTLRQVGWLLLSPKWFTVSAALLLSLICLLGSILHIALLAYLLFGDKP